MSEEETDESESKGSLQDSITFGTPAKGGAVKIYFDLKSMSDKDACELAKRAHGLSKYVQGLQ